MRESGRAPAPGRFVAIAAVASILVTSCAGDGNQTADGDRIVVATTNILGDVARNVVGDAATVEVLLPLGVDPHDFRPSAQDAAIVQRADLVIANGLGLEEGLDDVLRSAEADGANVLRIGEQVDPVPFGADATSAKDPHVWLDPLRMAEAAHVIAAELAAVDDGVDWARGADAYADALADADSRIRQIVSVIAPADRKLVTNHDSLRYFALRYGFDVVGTVIPGGTTLADPSSAELAQLVATIQAEGVAAIFVETTESHTLAEAIARDLGSEIAIVELYAGSLGASGSGADSLIGMLVINAERIAEALS